MSSNPMFKTEMTQEVALQSRPMTAAGAINKTAILLGIVAIVAYYAWTICAQGFYDKANILLYSGVGIGFVLAILTAFKPKFSPITAPIYALCEGLALGVVSFSYGSAFDGIVMNALGITVLTLFVMLFFYKTGLVKATPVFKKTIIIATFAIAVFYLISLILSFMGHPLSIFDGGLLGIGLSVIICAIAAFNFIIDFDFIEQGEQNMAPDYYEWYGAFGLLVTLVWLYLEILRLLAQLNRRN